MDSTDLTQHAQNVARAVVDQGYADVTLTKQHFDDYFYYRSLGFAGSFTSLLHARNVIDKAGLDALNQLCPPVASTEHEDRMSSAVLSLPEGTVARAKAAAKKTRPEGRVIELPVDVLTDNYEVVDEDVGVAERAEEATQAGDEDEDGTLIFEDIDPPEHRDLEVGSFVGEFVIEKILGEGAMGVVFEVARHKDGSRFAMKVIRLNPFGNNETRRERFRREVKAMQRLEHPGIVRVHGYGREGPYDWYVMDKIQGKDLGILLALGMDTERKLDLFEQICDAVLHAHERGVIHRDLKPSNVVVDEQDHLRVLDFGLAKLLDTELEGEQGTLTRSGVSLGTPYYMSPEQVSNPKLVSPRSDVFSLGVILFELVVGKRPFKTSTGDRAWEDPPVPSEQKPGLDPGYDRLILKALELRPDDRHQSVAELLTELRRLRAGVEGEQPEGDGSRPGLKLFLLLLLVLGGVLVVLILAAQGHLSG